MDEELEEDKAVDMAVHAAEATDVLSDAIDLVTGATLPAPLRRNFFKALARLCTAAVDIPVAHLESWAAKRRSKTENEIAEERAATSHGIAERQAETEARVRLITESGQQIGAEMQVDSTYAQRAGYIFAAGVIREQRNVDEITRGAARVLASSGVTPSVDAPREEIDDDWLNHFRQEAAQKSSEEMRSAFSRVLAGEIAQPGSFSVRAVMTLSHLDRATARAFARACSLALSLRAEERVVVAQVLSLGQNAAQNGLSQFGLSFDALNQLAEYSLIASDYNAYLEYPVVPEGADGRGSSFFYGGRRHFLRGLTEKTEGRSLKLHGVLFSGVGKQLLPIVDSKTDANYTEALSTFLSNRGAALEEC